MKLFVIHQDFTHNGGNLNQWRWYFTDETQGWKFYVKLVKDFENDALLSNGYRLHKDYNGDYCRNGDDYRYYEMQFERTDGHAVKFTFFTAHTTNNQE